MTVTEFEKYFKSLYLQLGMYALRIVNEADDAEYVVENAFLNCNFFQNRIGLLKGRLRHISGRGKKSCIMRVTRLTLWPQSMRFWKPKCQ